MLLILLLLLDKSGSARGDDDAAGAYLMISLVHLLPHLRHPLFLSLSRLFVRARRSGDELSGEKQKSVLFN